MLRSWLECQPNAVICRNHSRVLLLVLLSLGAASVHADLPATAHPAAVQQRVLERVNLVRARGHRCGQQQFAPVEPLSLSRPLQLAAAAHARDMARRGYFEHRARDGSEPKDRVRRAGYRPRLTGENIAFGPESAEEVVAGWLASPGHCANLMDPRFREMGVAVAQGRQRGHFYWVQDLATPAR